VADHLVPVVRETLTNVAKHAQAQQVEVVISASSSSLELIVRDDGSAGSRAATAASGSATCATGRARAAAPSRSRRRPEGRAPRCAGASRSEVQPGRHRVVPQLQGDRTQQTLDGRGRDPSERDRVHGLAEPSARRVVAPVEQQRRVAGRADREPELGVEPGQQPRARVAGVTVVGSQQKVRHHVRPTFQGAPRVRATGRDHPAGPTSTIQRSGPDVAGIGQPHLGVTPEGRDRGIGVGVQGEERAQ
jgi:hypothetical protein